jgi:hypothetical protein
LVAALVPGPDLIGVLGTGLEVDIRVRRTVLPATVIAAGGGTVKVVLHARGVRGRAGCHGDYPAQAPRGLG